MFDHQFAPLFGKNLERNIYLAKFGYNPFKTSWEKVWNMKSLQTTDICQVIDLAHMTLWVSWS